jgi:hypothetical protein
MAGSGHLGPVECEIVDLPACPSHMRHAQKGVACGSPCLHERPWQMTAPVQNNSQPKHHAPSVTLRQSASIAFDGQLCRLRSLCR